METSNLTLTALKIVKTLFEKRELYQGELVDLTDVNQGTVSKNLAKLTAEGWVQSRDEDVDASRVGRPARRYYRLTDQGMAGTRELLHEFEVKGPLDETPVNQWWSDIPMYNEQGPIYDFTYTATGRYPEAFCDAIWDKVADLKSEESYDLWTRNERSVRVRTNSLSMVKLLIHFTDEAQAEVYGPVWENETEEGEKSVEADQGVETSVPADDQGAA